LPDGAWWACLAEGVSAYNEVEGSKVDPNDGVHAYLARRLAARVMESGP